jgi:excisionase family DNA binding protein
MTIEPLPPILNVKQVCDLAGVSESTVRRAIRAGHLQGSRIGGRTLRFTTEDIRRWMSSTQTSTSNT